MARRPKPFETNQIADVDPIAAVGEPPVDPVANPIEERAERESLAVAIAEAERELDDLDTYRVRFERAKVEYRTAIEVHDETVPLLKAAVQDTQSALHKANQHYTRVQPRIRELKAKLAEPTATRQ